jgi:4-amino-4-deoxy-L-arabinose transferase-like glycosyltransferase
VTAGALSFATPWRRFLALALALTALRVAALIVGHPDLGPDEAQYWFWSQTPAFGYFSKPPFIAWAIAATTAMFGDAEWAVRLSAPFFQLGAAAFLFLTARRLADEKAAFWSGLAWLTMPGVFLSAALMTTDGPLLFFWSAALYFFTRLTDGAERRPFLVAATLGAAIGLGLLSKYAMLYFPLGALIAIALAPERRTALRIAPAGLSAAIALAFLAPNLWWNAQNDFRTIAHTAANANWTAAAGHLEDLVKFLGDQFGVAGPILLVLMIAAAASAFRQRPAATRGLRYLFAFAFPALAIVTIQAFIARAHANWAAVAYPSAVIAAAIFATETKQRGLAMQASLGLHLVAGAAFLICFSNAAIADAAGASGLFKRLRGWDAHGQEIAARAAGFDAILADDREVMGGLLYYARPVSPSPGPPVVAWNPNLRIDHHYEAFKAFDPETARRLLYVTTNPDGALLNNAFAVVIPLGASVARTTPSTARTLYLFEVSGYRPARS